MSSDLRIHLRITVKLNYQAKPIAVANVEKNFMLEASLQNHVKTHSGISYKCEVKNDCEFKTKSYSRYREHNKYGHRDTKDFPCTVCNTPFQTPSEMQHDHVRKMP